MNRKTNDAKASFPSVPMQPHCVFVFDTLITHNNTPSFFRVNQT